MSRFRNICIPSPIMLGISLHDALSTHKVNFEVYLLNRSKSFPVRLIGSPGVHGSLAGTGGCPPQPSVAARAITRFARKAHFLLLFRYKNTYLLDYSCLLKGSLLAPRLPLDLSPWVCLEAAFTLLTSHTHAAAQEPRQHKRLELVSR